MKKCPKCSSTQIDEGRSYGYEGGRNAYRSNRFSTWKQPFVTVPQQSFVCLQCGYTETYTDTEALKQKLPST